MLRYGAAVLIVGGATLLSLFNLEFSRGTPFLLFYAVPPLALLCGGLGPGLLAAGLSGVAVRYVLLAPYYSFALQQSAFTRVAIFVGIQVTLCLLLDSRNHALRRSEERLSSIIDSAMDAIITVDENQHVVLFNAAAEKIFGCPASEVLGKPLDRFLPERFRVIHRNHVQRFGTTGASARSMSSLGTLYGQRANGEEFPLEATISHARTGGQKLYTVILRDLTERKQSEELARLYAHTQELGRLKTEFFANISHELRTPLALILGPVRKRLAAGEMSQAERRDLEVVERNAALLLRHVNDLLDLSKLDVSKMNAEYAETDLARLGRLVASHFTVLARERALDEQALCRRDVQPQPGVVDLTDYLPFLAAD